MLENDIHDLEPLQAKILSPLPLYPEPEPEFTVPLPDCPTECSEIFDFDDVILLPPIDFADMICDEVEQSVGEVAARALSEFDLPNVLPPPSPLLPKTPYYPT